MNFGKTSGIKASNAYIPGYYNDLLNSFLMLYETLLYIADPVFDEMQFICHRNKQGDMIKNRKRIGSQENEIASECVRVTKKLSHLLTNKNSQS